VDHNLTTEKIVIVDSLNYIKGYRYELYCSARTVRTPHCAVWVGCEESTSTRLNNERLGNGQDGYDLSM
jgi:protein KTI12